MVIHNGYEALDLKNPVVTLGIFDGVHRGHQALLGRLIALAREVRGEPVVMTFDPHPRLVLEKGNEKLSFLSTMDEKIKLLEEAGAEHLIIIRFTRRFSEMKACDFVEKVLAAKVRTRHLIVGHDHHFGHHGKGNYDIVKKCAGSLNFVVEQVKGLEAEGITISSSMIREALLKGNLDKANKWLGYNYSLIGSVIEGKRIGRKIGFPTANLKLVDDFKLVPGDGVYAVETQIDNIQLPGMLSIGSNPTVNKTSGKRSIEVHIINFEKEIYGRKIGIVFRRRLRDEIRFNSMEELARQMNLDRINAITALKMNT
jgi:riboflavin kinase/FMN adenylyltransferase